MSEQGKADQITVDPTSIDFRDNAMTIFRDLLIRQPLTRLDDDSVLLCRHEDVRWALTSREVQRPTEWSLKRKPAGPFHEFGLNNMIGMNPPNHTRFRQSIMHAFSRKQTERLIPLIEQTCDRLIDEMPEEGDFIDQFALPLPVAVICHMLDIPTTDLPLLRDASAAMLAGLEITATPEELATAGEYAARLFEHLSDIARNRERNLGEDLLSLLIRNEQADKLSRTEVIWATVTLLIAGHETTTHLLGNGLLALIRHPEQLARLQQDESLAAAAVEEFLRYDPPIYILFREAKEDVRVCDTDIPAGTRLMLSIAAANHDPRVFEAPEELDIGRGNADEHLSFAAGRHLCAGHGTARLEGKIAFSKLARRLTDVRLSADPSPRPGLSCSKATTASPSPAVSMPEQPVLPVSRSGRKCCPCVRSRHETYPLDVWPAAG